MLFTPADGEMPRWRRVDAYIDSRKRPGDLIEFREIEDLLGIGKPAACNVIHQVRVQREKLGKPTLVTMRGAGWLLARPEQELEEDTRRHVRGPAHGTGRSGPRPADPPDVPLPEHRYRNRLPRHHPQPERPDDVLPATGALSMLFTPADGEMPRWRRVDAYIDSRKRPGDLIEFREIENLLGIGKPAACNVIHQVRVQREKLGKPTLVTMRGAGWLLARPEQELEEDTRRHVHLLTAVESRVRLLGSLQNRRGELSDEERRSLDFKSAQTAAQATILGSRRASAADILSSAGRQHVPITAQQRAGQ